MWKSHLKLKTKNKLTNFQASIRKELSFIFKTKTKIEFSKKKKKFRKERGSSPRRWFHNPMILHKLVISIDLPPPVCVSKIKESKKKKC